MFHERHSWLARWLILFSLGPMSRTTKLGLWLIPWFPVLVLCLTVSFYVTGPQYTVASVLKMVPDASGAVQSVSVEKPAFAFHPTPFSVMSWIFLAMFLTGLILLIVSLARRILARTSLKT